MNRCLSGVRHIRQQQSHFMRVGLRFVIWFEILHLDRVRERANSAAAVSRRADTGGAVMDPGVRHVRRAVDATRPRDLLVAGASSALVRTAVR
jgi:hypothetical protein